ncbi:MAG: Hpt domain-containing protein [Bacteroidetes bacterium]|nr:MAG: Hpt domain-containing protein [Bacteroidota bacterium]
MNNVMYQYIDLSYMDLMTDGDADMKRTMLEMLLNELPTEMANMKHLLEQKDWDALGKASHKMKSSLAFVGNAQLTEANQKIEHFSKAGENLDQIPALMATVEELLGKALAELKTASEEL